MEEEPTINQADLEELESVQTIVITRKACDDGSTNIRVESFEAYDTIVAMLSQAFTLYTMPPAEDDDEEY